MDFFFVPQNEKKSTNDNGTPYFVSYRAWIIVGFFILLSKTRLLAFFLESGKFIKCPPKFYIMVEIFLIESISSV